MSSISQPFIYLAMSTCSHFRPLWCQFHKVFFVHLFSYLVYLQRTYFFNEIYYLFPGHTFLQKPYPGRGLPWKERVYNYRHSRSRRTVECSFGTLAARFRVLHSMIMLKPENAIVVSYCCVVLHNLLIDRRPQRYLDHVSRQHLPGARNIQWREADTMANLQRRHGNTGLEGGKAVRDYIRDYVNSDNGLVTWQADAVVQQVSVRVGFGLWFRRGGGWVRVNVGWVGGWGFCTNEFQIIWNSN